MAKCFQVFRVCFLAQTTGTIWFSEIKRDERRSRQVLPFPKGIVGDRCLSAEWRRSETALAPTRWWDKTEPSVHVGESMEGEVWHGRRVGELNNIERRIGKEEANSWRTDEGCLWGDEFVYISMSLAAKQMQGTWDHVKTEQSNGAHCNHKQSSLGVYGLRPM